MSLRKTGEPGVAPSQTWSAQLVLPAQLAPGECRLKYKKAIMCGSDAGRVVHRGTVGEEDTQDEATPYIVGTVNERFEECQYCTVCVAGQ